MTGNACSVAGRRASWIFAILVSLASVRVALSDDAVLFPSIGAKSASKATLLAIDDYSLPLSVEIADERFGLLPEYSADNAGLVAGQDGLDCAVKWPKASLDALVGKTVRLYLHLKKGEHAEPRFYAAYVFSK